MIKRLFDLLISFSLLPLAVVLCLITGIISYLLERENPLFAQKRVGINGSVFTIYKLRTMRVNTKDVATHQVSASSVTRIGGLLRKTKIDELPQLINVINGTMSLVGPRPGLPTQKVLFEERDKRGVFSIKPGITGLSQIEGIDMSDPEILAISDAKYLENRSNLGDLKLLALTFLGAGGGDKVREGS